MKLLSFSFIDQPVTHIFPPIYEGLGLPELSNCIELNLSFIFFMEKSEYSGNGTIRKLLNSGEIFVVLNKIKGIGPVKERELKKLIYEAAESSFHETIQDKKGILTVYHRDFIRKKE